MSREHGLERLQDCTDGMEGYKKTEVGVISRSWQVKSLIHLCEAIVDCAHSTPTWTNNGVIVLRNQNIRNGRLDLSNPSYTDETHFIERTRRATPTSGDIIITREAPMGEVCMIPYGLRCCLGQRMVLLRPNYEKCCSYYLLYALQSEYVRQIIKVNGGTGSTVSNLRIPLIKSLSIPLPPLAEQKAIALTLSDTDALIAECDRAITKKRHIKQGAMQQLLTGKMRLPGFSGEWEVKKLEELLKVRHGKSQHDVVDKNGEFPILATGGEIGRSKTYLYDKPSVLIGRKGTIDIPQYMDIPFWTIDTLFYTEILNNTFPKFIFYRFNLVDWYSYNEASGVPSLNAKTIENIEIYYPPLSEQKAIAQILSDMDAEITALEKKRDKYKAIKKGMMQELLTGKTRLKNDAYE